MIRHCVMFTWNDDATDEAKAGVSTGLDQLASQLGLSDFRHGPDAGLADGNWDYVVVASFDDASGYAGYAADQDHLNLIAETIRPAISARAAVQYEI